MREKVFILLLFSQFNFAQNVAWENFIGGKNSEYLFDMIPTADEGFILGGSSLSSKTGIKNSDNLGDLDFFMWKMNHKGKIDWEFNFGGSNQDILKKIIQTKDGGYLLAGFTNSNNIKNIKNFGYNDILILKLNAFGVIEWSKSFGNKGNDELIDIIEVKDGYVFTAKSDSNLLENHKNHGNTFSLIYKVDTKGNIKWTNSYSGDKNDVPVSIIESNNNIYVAINSNSNKKGSKELNKIGKYDIVLLKINNEGILTDQKIYGNEGDDYAVKFQKRENELYIAGYTYSKENVSLNFPTSKDDSDIFLLKINEELNIISNHVFHIKGEDILTSITIDQNENLNFGAYRIDQKTGYKNMFVFKVNNENEIIWKKDFNNKYDNILRSIIFTRDNSLVIASNTNKKSNNSNGNYDFNILKFESEEITKKNKNNEKYNIEAFPNPTQQYTNINVNYDFDEAKLHIFDINGKLIFSKSITNRSIPIDVSIYPQGIYIVNVISNISNNSVKIIKIKMNNLFKILLLIIITNSKVFAQTDIKNFYTVPPNPESRKLIQSFDSNVNKPNGSVGISYPIFQITQGDLSINLSLGYNSTGIKVNDIASNIGLGWELNGIPKITRTVRGLADEFPNSGYMNTNIKITSFNDLNQLNKLYYIKLAQENLNDFEADLFYVDLGYKSFKMFWNQIENRFITIPYNDDIKIEFGNSNNRGIESWIITDTNGKKFYFGHNKNHTKTSFEYSDVIQSFTISRNSSLNNIKNVTANSSWNILEIYESNNNTNITFEYETISETTEIYELNNTFYKDIKHLISSNGFQECVSTDDGYNMSLINYNKYNLKNIYSKNNLIKFNYSENPRDDLGFKNIVSFELYSGNILLKSILLNQSYTNSNSPDPFNNLYDASKRRKRLILNSISEIVGNNSIETKYKYNNILLPPRFSYAQDFWGYYNGENSNVNFNPQIVFNKRMYGKAIRTVDTIVNKAQILEQIILPTGGIIKYNFETNNIHKSQIITDSDLSYAHNKLFEARIDFAKSNTYKINDYLYSRTFNIPETISGNIQFYSSVTGCNPSNNLTFDCNWTINLKGISSTNSNINIDYQNISTTQLASFLPPGDYKLTANYNEPSALSNNSTNPNFNFYIKYNYLDNDPNLTNLNVGGLRINEIKYLAQDNKVLKIEKYKYNNFSNDPVINNNDIDYIENVNLSDISSGLINGFPQFLKLETFICTFYKTNGYIKIITEVIEIFSNPLSEYGNINGSSILYRNVSKEILNGNKSIKELYTYSGSINRTLYYKNNIIKYLGDNGELMSTSLNDKYWAYVNPYFSNFNSYEQNLPISKTYFGGDLIDYKVLDNTKLIYQEKSFYDVLVFNKKRIIPFFGFRASLPSSNDANQSNAVLSDEFHYGIYNIALEESRLVSKTKYDFIDNDFISSNENYFYDNKNRISKTITNDNTGSSVSENYYPDPNQHSQLLQLNIIDNPIKTILYKNNELINKTIVEYNPNISFTKPSRVLNYKSEFDENPDYIIFSQYDMYDNILKYTTDNLIFKKIVWGYNNSLPIMEIEDIGNYFEEDNFSSIINASNNYNNLNLLSLLKDFKINFGNSILHKSYTHIPGIGLEHVIDQDNNTIKYEYDDFYRLYKIYNNNKLIESYQYNYKN